MANDSSTGGYLSPSSTNGDLNDAALAAFLQGMVVGITGIAGPLVRPRWQAEPPNIPAFGTDWASIGPGSRSRDPFSAVVQQTSSEGVGSAVVVRNRTMDILCSFYGPSAETNAELLAQGLEVAQNREAMQLQGFNLVSSVKGPVIAPALIKQRWYYRVDITFTLRQQQQYTYPVLNLEGVEASLTVQEGSDSTNEKITISIADSGFGANGYGENPYGQ